MWKQRGIRKHGAFTRVACQPGWCWWGGGVTLFLPCFVQTEGGGVSLSMGVLRISGGLWGGTAEGGGADNDPAPPA